MTDIATTIVDGIFAAISGAVSLTEADRAKAIAATRQTLDAVTAADPGPLGPRAAAVIAKYIRGTPLPDPADVAPQGVLDEAQLWSMRAPHRLSPIAIPTGFGHRKTEPPESGEDGA